MNKTIYFLFFALSFCSLKEEGIPQSIISPGTNEISLSLSSEVLGQFVVSRFPLSMVSADFDGDQLPDLAYTLGYSARSNLLVQCSSRPRGEWLGSAGSKLWLQLEGRDVNNDFLLDLVLTGVSPAIPAAIFLGDGEGNFRSVDPWNFFGTYPQNKKYFTFPANSKTELAAIIPNPQEPFEHSFLEFRSPLRRAPRSPLCEGQVRCLCFLSPQSSPRSPPPFQPESALYFI